MTRSHDGEIHGPGSRNIHKNHQEFPINPGDCGEQKSSSTAPNSSNVRRNRQESPTNPGDDGEAKSSSTVSNVVTAGSNETARACAACKYQRRRCARAPGCPMARYFPADHERQFLNCHKLFGLRNMMNLYEKLSPNQRDVAFRNVIIEAEIKAQNPVGGCYQIIDRLHNQIQHYHAELAFYLNQLAIYKNPSYDNSPFPSASGSMGPLPNTDYQELNVGLPSMSFQPESGNEFVGGSMLDENRTTQGFSSTYPSSGNGDGGDQVQTDRQTI